MRDLASEGLLDALASDYVPASLLQAAIALTRTAGLSIPQALALVTAAPARLARLDDRGRLAEGLRADLVLFALADDTPVVREVFLAGRRVF